MKSRLALVLSLSGVLVAGSAAAYVNTQVLDSGDGTAAAEDAPVVGSTIPGSVVVTLPTQTVPPATAPPATMPAGAAAPSGGAVLSGAPAAEAPVVTQATYAIGAAGTVTLDRAGGQLRIVSAVPSSGWTVAKAESEGPLAIKVTLRSSTTQVEFRANLLYDVVSTSVESTDLTAPAPAAGGGSTGYSDDDEYEDDEYEDHDEEDEDHEDEDHEEEGDDD